MSLHENLKTVELVWIKPLYRHVSELFETQHLPSHNHEHHARVWFHAKEIIIALTESGFNFTDEKITAILIACFFHDTGLSITLDEKHGRAGGQLCNSFFNSGNFKPPANMPEILEAIENHDNKSYHSNLFPADDIRTIVAIADDVDALGAQGIFRYAEIYLLRGIPILQLADNVLPNLQKRFTNIENTYSIIPNWLERKKEAFEYTRKFFSTLNLNEANSSEHKLIQIIKAEIIENKRKPSEVWELCRKTLKTAIIQDFVCSIIESDNLTQVVNNELDNSNSETELIFEARQINRFALVLLVSVILLAYIPFFIFNKNEPVLAETGKVLKHLILWLIPIIILHEGLHGLTWMLASKSYRTIKFGFNTKMMAPYTHCIIPLSKTGYLLGGLAPLVVMGIVPAIVAAISGNTYLYVLALFCIFTSGGDMLSCYYLLKQKGDFMVQDHPEKLGFILA